jgi:hypothetical protein
MLIIYARYSWEVELTCAWKSFDTIQDKEGTREKADDVDNTEAYIINKTSR